MTILIIDNDKDFTHFLITSLSEHNVNVVESLGVAKIWLENNKTDLIIVNIDVYEMNYINNNFLNEIKIPKIAITYNCDINKISCISTLDYIVKSLNKKQILDRIYFNIKNKLPKNRFSPEVFDQIKAFLDKELLVA